MLLHIYKSCTWEKKGCQITFEKLYEFAFDKQMPVTVQFSNLSSILGFVGYSEVLPSGKTRSSCREVIYAL